MRAKYMRNKPGRLKPVARGFTLIELLIAVVIVGILGMVAYPSYTDYARRGKIVEGIGELSTSRVRLEQYYQDNRNYGSTASACGVTMPVSKHFSFTCNWGAGGTSQSFLLTATGLESGGMSGFVFTVDNSNAQKTTQFDGAAVTATCWLKKKSDVC